jgi:hypothetical protein
MPYNGWLCPTPDEREDREDPMAGRYKGEPEQGVWTVTWVYQQSEPRLWTVGYYGPTGIWYTDSDHSSKEAAAQRVHWLNGGNDGPA